MTTKSFVLLASFLVHNINMLPLKMPIAAQVYKVLMMGFGTRQGWYDRVGWMTQGMRLRWRDEVTRWKKEPRCKSGRINVNDQWDNYGEPTTTTDIFETSHGAYQINI